MRSITPTRTLALAADLGKCLLLLTLLLAAPLYAAEPTPEPPTALPSRPVISLTLGECLKFAARRQPALAAQRASLAAAEDGARALDSLWVPRFLAPDLPVRRQQANLGVTAAAAGIGRAEQDTIYAVTRTWFTVTYAREQERVARGVIERLTALSEAAQQQLKAGARDITQNDVDRTAFFIDMAEIRRLQAAEGAVRALAALKEAIGLEMGCGLDVPTSPLPEPQVRPVRDEIIVWALRYRAGVIQAEVFAAAASLEIEAQRSSHGLRVGTFAAGADIHSQPVPQANHGTEYSPGTEPPAMPGTLVGGRQERVQHARSLSERAAALAEKTRELVALEAENTWLRWHEAKQKLVPARRATETAERLAENLRQDFTSQQKVRVEDVINAQVQASTARAQLNQFLYDQIVALADLERVTGGAFCAGLAALPSRSGSQDRSPPPASGR